MYSSPDIRIFIQKAESDPSIVGQYFKAGGKPLEFAQTLNKIDKDELFPVSHIFNGLHLLLMEKMNQATASNTDAIETCAYILNNHRTSIERLLASNYAPHKKAVLKFLTDTVYLAPHLARELLTTFNIVFNAETLSKFTAHERNECDLPDAERVRTCYIYFILAFIIEGNHVLIKNLLDRHELLMSLFSGLMYDSKDVVVLVLSSFLKFVLQSTSVTKTKKVQVFTANVVTELLRLFEWKGPAYFAASINKKTKEKAAEYIDTNDFDTVCNISHTFLCELLASRKNGIAFKCLGQRKNKVNRVQKKVLLSMDHFTAHAQKSDLIIQVLKACPELMKKFTQKNAPYLEPLKKNNNWLAAVDFFSRLISEMGPEIIQYQVDKMNIKEMVELIKDICMAPEILQQLRSKNTLKSDSITVRFKSTNLLYLMFKQCNRYLLELSKSNTFQANGMKKMKFEMINHILLQCPSVQNILLSLHMTQVDESAENGAMFKHLECILDLLLIISKSIPSFIDTTSSVINYIKILAPIYELNREQECSTRIEFKAVKLMLALEPKALSPKTELFDQIIQSFVNVYRFGAHTDQYEAKQLLRTVFQNTGLFENGPLEIDLWLAAINHIDEDLLTAVREFIVTQIKSFDVNDPQLTQIQTTMPLTIGKNCSELFANIESGTTLKGILDVATLRPFFIHCVHAVQQLQKTKRIDENAEADDEDDDTASIIQYIENVAFYLFVYLPISESVYYAIDCIPHRFSGFMKKWITQSKCGKLPKDATMDVINNFYASLIGTDAIQSLPEIFASHLTLIECGAIEASSDGAGVVVRLDGNAYMISEQMADETKIMILLYLLMFVTNRYHKCGLLDAAHCTKSVKHFVGLMKLLDAIAVRNSESRESGFELNEPDTNPSTKALKYIFMNCYFLLQSFDIWSKESHITRFVYELVKNIERSNDDCFDDTLLHYRKKITSQIVKAVSDGGNGGTSQMPSEHCAFLIDMMTIFRLDVDNCCDILTNLAKLSHLQFVTRENDVSIYANILTYALKRLAELKERSLPEQTIAQITTIYMSLVRAVNVEINYQCIEEALFAYLSVYYQHIAAVDDKLFDALFEARRLNKSTVKLACLLLDRKCDLFERLPKLIEANLTKKELIYPLINVIASKQFEFDGKLLTSLYGEYKNGIMKAIEKPQKAAVIYKENVLSSVFLIEKCMPIKECTDFSRKTIVTDTSDIFQLQIIKSIYLKVLMHSDSVEAISQAYQQFLQVFVRLFATVLKQETLDMKKVNTFIFIAYDWTRLKSKLLPAALSSQLRYEMLCEQSFWLQCGKLCLKHGLKLQKDDAGKGYNEDAAVLLKAFAYLCNEIYVNDGNGDDVRTFYEMAISHPNFFDIVTMETNKSTLKTSLVYLLYVLIRKNATVIDASHIPILLSGYQGKMAHSDQFILAILQLFERSGCDTHKYRPFMFGESALSHYSLANAAQAKAALIQEPPMMQVISLIDVDVAENTLVNFPIWRQLNVIDQVPTMEFHCRGIPGEEHSNVATMAKSNVEKLVELGETKFDVNILSESSRRDETYDNVYDPAFLIPLMQMAFAPDTLTKPLRPAQNGLLAITFACLSANDKNLRLAAAVAIQRYRCHMESTRFMDNKLWLHIFDGIRNGIQSLTAEAQKRKTHRIPRVPYIAGIFYARTINTMMNPLSELYRPLSTYLLIKNSFEFVTVPEFNILFHSPDVNHHIHRSFILDVMRDGLKTNHDFNVLQSNHIFKALLGYYGSATTTRERNIQILTVINAAVKIPKSAKLMIDVVGILPWLSAAIDNIEFFQFDFIDLLCTILNNLYNSLAINRIEYGPNTFSSIEVQMLQLLLKLLPNLSQRIADVSFVRYVNVLRTIIVQDTRAQYLTSANINHLSKCMSAFVSGDLIWDFDNLIGSDTAYRHCERKSVYNQRLRDMAGLNEQLVFIMSSIREIIVRWKYTCTTSEQQ